MAENQNTKPAEQASAKKAARTAAAGQEELLVYVGPNLVGRPEISLLSYQTFKEIPKAAKADANLKQLFVPLSKLAESRQEMVVKGSRLYNLAQAALAPKEVK